MAMTETTFVGRSGTLRAIRGAASSPSPTQHADDGVEPNAAGYLAGPQGERLAYSVAEVAVITGLSRDLLYDQMRAGRLAFLKVGRRRIITRQNLEAFLARPAL
jgi:excisionase family DNA binding protein